MKGGKNFMLCQKRRESILLLKFGCHEEKSNLHQVLLHRNCGFWSAFLLWESRFLTCYFYSQKLGLLIFKIQKLGFLLADQNVRFWFAVSRFKKIGFLPYSYRTEIRLTDLLILVGDPRNWTPIVYCIKQAYFSWLWIEGKLSMGKDANHRPRILIKLI